MDGVEHRNMVSEGSRNKSFEPIFLGSTGVCLPICLVTSLMVSMPIVNDCGPEGSITFDKLQFANMDIYK